MNTRARVSVPVKFCLPHNNSDLAHCGFSAFFTASFAQVKNFAKVCKLTVFFGTFAVIFYCADVWEKWNTRGKLDPSGGRYFFSRVEIPGPLFRQNDPKWGKIPLGPSHHDTIGSAGCAVTSAAMVLAGYGIDTDPERLNQFLVEHEGFTPQAWLKWEGAAAIAPDRVKHVYEDLPTYYLIDKNLSEGNPVIVRLRYPDGHPTHFVVIAGKQGYDYLVRDPGRGASKGLYPLKEFGSPIEALRFYRRL